MIGLFSSSFSRAFSRIFIVASLVFLPVSAHAAGDAVTPPDIDWPHEGIFGQYDKEAVQRGFQVYREVCAACHGMKYLAYRNLSEIGYNDAQIKAVASEYLVEDGPNDEGDMFERPAKGSDTFVEPYANEEAARYANNGALPLDLSLIVKARANGEDYIYALLTGYTDAPEGETLGESQYWNTYMLGHNIAMPPPIIDGAITYSNGDSASLEQASSDVTQFLAWASEPHLDTRKRMGLKVVLYLMLLSFIMYLAKKKVWRDIKK